MDDAIDDSDDEVDYTKMDLGNKKGPIGETRQAQTFCVPFHWNIHFFQVVGISTLRRNIRIT